MYYTSIEQSKKLLELGLSPETADMTYSKENNLDGYHLTTMPFRICYGGFINENGNIPCWSSEALVELIPEDKENPFITIKHEDNMHNITCNGIITAWHLHLIDAIFEVVCSIFKQN